jgi:hypothetical protein
MHDYREARSEGLKITRLTLFPPSGNRIQLLISSTYEYERGALHYTDHEGIKYETNLPYAIEHIREGHQKAPFSEAFAATDLTP